MYPARIVTSPYYLINFAWRAVNRWLRTCSHNCFYYYKVCKANWLIALSSLISNSSLITQLHKILEIIYLKKSSILFFALPVSSFFWTMWVSIHFSLIGNMNLHVSIVSLVAWSDSYSVMRVIYKRISRVFNVGKHLALVASHIAIEYRGYVRHPRDDDKIILSSTRPPRLTQRERIKKPRRHCLYHAQHRAHDSTEAI